MNPRKLAIVAASLASATLILAGCSTESTESAIGSSSEFNDCAVTAEGSGGIEVKASDNCVLMNQGEFALLYVLARDDVEESRVEVNSGDPLTVVPLEAPEEDGGFLMGFVGENSGSAQVDVYAKIKGEDEMLLQSLLVTVGDSGEPVSGSGGWSDLESN
jgi:hypothetical protein